MKRTNRRQNERYKLNILPIFTSFLSIALCALCLVSTSWAWFTADSSTGVTTITAGNYAVKNVEVENSLEAASSYAQMSLSPDDESAPAPPSPTVELFSDANGEGFLAKKNTPYTITASMSGTADGYLRVETCDGVFVTTDMEPCFHLLLSEECWVSIRASWGAPDMDCIFFTGDTLLGDGYIPECDCLLRCIDAPNLLCEVCAERPHECLGELPKPVVEVTPQVDEVLATPPLQLPQIAPTVVPEPPKCTCEYECRDGIVDPLCAVCAAHGECAGIPWVVSCTCTTPCTDDTVNTACSVCVTSGIAACAAEPQTVECTCKMRCSLDWGLDITCPVCAVDGYDGCRYGQH